MSRQIISTGTTPNDGTGDSLASGASKINSNFNEIYTTFGDGVSLTGFQGATGSIGPQGVGVTGPQGSIGPQGFGPQGAQGNNGSLGPQGPQGPAGGISFSVTNSGASSYTFNPSILGISTNPTLTLARGFTYYFNVNATGHPFWIKTSPVIGISSSYDIGTENNGVQTGTLVFTVPNDAPSTLYYICQIHSAMQGTINVVEVGYFGPQGAQGVIGPQGVQGFQGAQGVQGAIGPQGFGPQGVQGVRGPQGSIGFQGAQGVQGAQGFRGPQGVQGPQGIVGNQGIQGAIGPQGNIGPQGVQGSQGIQGAQGFGPQGPSGLPGGPQGTIGPQGIRGPQGVQGHQGAVGFQGLTGPRGPQGVQGFQGPQGIIGPQGTQGVQGVLGPQGSQGIQGASGGALESKTITSSTTGTVGIGSTVHITFPGFKSYALTKVQTSTAARTVIYTDATSRTNDSSRAEGATPSAGSGVIADVVTTGLETQLVSPGVIGFNNDNPTSTDIYAKVVNKSGVSTDISIELTILKLEN